MSTGFNVSYCRGIHIASTTFPKVLITLLSCTHSLATILPRTRFDCTPAPSTHKVPLFFASSTAFFHPRPSRGQNSNRDHGSCQRIKLVATVESRALVRVASCVGRARSGSNGSGGPTFVTSKRRRTEKRVRHYIIAAVCSWSPSLFLRMPCFMFFYE